MGVLPGYTGKGIGSALLATTLLTMKRRGFTTCCYHCVVKLISYRLSETKPASTSGARLFFPSLPPVFVLANLLVMVLKSYFIPPHYAVSC